MTISPGAISVAKSGSSVTDNGEGVLWFLNNRKNHDVGTGRHALQGLRHVQVF